MYLLQCLDSDDSFSFSNPDFDLSDLKQMAKDREKDEIFWEDKFENDCIYAVDEDGTQRYVIIY